MKRSTPSSSGRCAACTSPAIVEGDRIVHLRGFGRARPGGEAPTPHTPFGLGSTTKSMTALAIMQLVEAAKVDLDAPVQRYLPWFRVADPEASAAITVRHLLVQTSGLPGLGSVLILADLDQSPSATERMVRGLATVQPSRPVGAAFEYSNWNYMVLGLIVEAASGESYPDYVQGHIFAPLDMRHSYTTQAEAKRDGLAVGHHYWFTYPVPLPDLPFPRAHLPAGGVISCAEDMAHYLIACLNSGRYGDVPILSPAGIARMHRGGAKAVEMGYDAGEYGMGWFIRDLGRTQAVFHGGNLADFSSYMALLPEQKKAVVLLINADHYGLPPILSDVGLAMTALLAGQPSAAIHLGVVPWAMRAMLLLPLLQVAGAAGTLRRVRRWRREPGLRPRRILAQHILLPLIPNLALAALPIYLLARRMTRYLLLFMPDVAWTVLVCGGFAGLWSFVRTGLVLRAVAGRSRKGRAS